MGVTAEAVIRVLLEVSPFVYQALWGELLFGRIKSIYLRYLQKLLIHKWFVFLAGLKVGNIPLWRLIFHDLSKFSWLEFDAYSRHFYGQDDTRWKEALNHHFKRNPHHWNYWILYDEPLPMPETYIREMVADWMGAGRAYQKSWDMTDWLDANIERIRLHQDTRIYLYNLLREQGYDKFSKL